MKHKSESVRLLADDGGVIVVNPDLDGNHEPVTIEVQEADETPLSVTVRLDGETADALADAIDRARGRRPRQRRAAGEGE